MTFFAFLLGLIVGSFLNVCIHRWPDERSVVRPGSHCPNCTAPIRWRHNIPLVSYFLLHGRCASCEAPISWRYPVVEAANGLMWAALVYQFGLQPFTYKAALFCSLMLILIVTDFEHMILPDEVTKGGALLGLLLSFFIPLPDGVTRILWVLVGADPSARAMSFTESAFAAALFGGMLWAIGELYYRVRQIDGLGLGDVKMAAMIGAFWGVPQTLLILLVGSLLGAVAGSAVALLSSKSWRTYELPFGSYLGIAAIAVTFFSEDLFGAYWAVVEGAAR